jgi:phthiocerol/phenolphthiocerol synthesis type-I polyketide synthase E
MTSSDKIAVIGICCKFPGAENAEEFFNNCLNGVQSIKQFSDEELKLSGIPQSVLDDERYIKYGAVLGDIDKFDNRFFSYTPYEAELTDPQQRIFLECAWGALENSGYAPNKYQGRIAVFGSCSISTYLLNNILKSNVIKEKGLDHFLLIGNDKDFLCTRVSYKLGLTGPSVTVQSGCSSSLVAIHLACRSIYNGETDLALAGGVSISVPQKAGYYYQEGSIFSKDGQCRPFDINSSGMVKGNGCGIVVLKLLDKAIQDNDYIYAVINSTAINNDGKNKIGYTAPSIAGQAEVIKMTLEKSGINPENLSYIEAHGTGTRLGDPIEVRALAKVFNTEKRQFCVIGSSKASIGHLDAAAGVAGLIKSALILKKGRIPRSTNFEANNPELKLEDTPFFVSKTNIELPNDKKNYVAVSSFGMGGTNAHAILESYVEKDTSVPQEKELIIPYSAKTENALKIQEINLLKALKEFLKQQISLSDIAYTLCFGREEFSCRRFIIARNIPEAIRQLENTINLISNFVESYNSTLLSIGEEWSNGGDISWEFQFDGISGKRVPLPGYPFERKSFWINAASEAAASIKVEERSASPLFKEEILKEIIAIWKENFKDDQIQKDDNFFELGGESLMALNIIEDIKRRFAVTTSFDFLIHYPTPDKIANYLFDRISKPVEEKTCQNIHKIVDGNSGKKLFLIHPAGGNIYCYKDLAEYLNKSFDIYAISFPDGYLTDCNSLEKLAGLYIQQIEKIENESSFVLGGYSFGGNVAVEMALQLQRKEKIIENIILIDSLVPETYSLETPDKAHYIKAFPLVMDLAMKNEILAKDVYQVEYENLKIDEVIERMKAKNRISSKIETQDLLHFFDIWMNNHVSLTKHRPVGKVKSRIAVFYADEELPVYMYDFIHMQKKSYKLWEKYCENDIQAVVVKGNHFTLMSDKNNMKLLVEKLNSWLSDIHANS